MLVAAALAVAPPAHAAASYPPITGTISGATTVGRTLQATYLVNGTGGPAVSASGVTVGNITFNATLSGNNVSSASIAPPTGILVKGEVTLRFTAPNVSEVVTLRVELTSSYHGQNASSNLTFAINVVQPYVLSGTLVAGATSVTGFNMTVSVDGTPVGQIAVPTISANGSYHFSYNYVPQSLGAGWHTIAVSVAPQHGLVSFQGGIQELSVQFYVMGPSPDYVLDVGVGVVAFAAAVFIWGSVVGARRRGRRVR